MVGMRGEGQMLKKGFEVRFDGTLAGLIDALGELLDREDDEFPDYWVEEYDGSRLSCVCVDPENGRIHFA